MTEPPPKSGFQTLTQSILQEGGGAEVEHRSLPVALLSSVACELAPLRTVHFMCFFTFFFTFLLLFLIRVSSAMIMYDRRTLLDI